ncbi:MAG: phosphoribosylanthranilate isomerase [Nitrospinales bacterium]
MTKLKPRVKVKVCGMTSLQDALMAVGFGADAVGFIFYKKSPRFVTEKIVKGIALPPFVSKVGVFVNETSERINKIADACRLDTVQLHGDESPAFCRKIRTRVVKAIRLKDAKSLELMPRYEVDGFLLDSYVKDIHGGTGQTCDWNLVRKAGKFGPVILAGGLCPANIDEAVTEVQPYGVDVCSGVEKSPGKKDRAKVRDFIFAAHNAIR